MAAKNAQQRKLREEMKAVLDMQVERSKQARELSRREEQLL